jgi:hypothetical protein
VSRNRLAPAALIRRPWGKGAMTAAENYRRNAEECVRIANKTKEPAAKALLLQMADSWLDLARDVEAREGRERK